MNKHDTTPHIHLVGQGVISSLIATHALLEDRPFTQYVRTRRNAPTVHWLTGEQHVLPSAHVLYPKSANTMPFTGIIIIATKAYQVSTVLSDLQHCMAKDAVLVLLHNGLGTHETAQALFPKHTIYAATTSMAGYSFTDQSSSKTCIQHTAWGQTQIGKIQDPQLTRTTKNQSDDDTLEYLSEIIPELHNKTDIFEALYTKLAVNAVINPLTAIHNIKNGCLADSKYLPTMQAIVQEIVLLAKHKKLKLSYGQLWNTILSIVHATADNYSSMHQDITYGRRTEVDFINGFVVREAQKIGLNTPANEKLLKHIHILEERL